jgi:hypothetical protein
VFLVFNEKLREKLKQQVISGVYNVGEAIVLRKVIRTKLIIFASLPLFPFSLFYKPLS